MSALPCASPGRLFLPMHSAVSDVLQDLLQVKVDAPSARTYSASWQLAPQEPDHATPPPPHRPEPHYRARDDHLPWSAGAAGVRLSQPPAVASALRRRR